MNKDAEPTFCWEPCLVDKTPACLITARLPAFDMEPISCRLRGDGADTERVDLGAAMPHQRFCARAQ